MNGLKEKIVQAYTEENCCNAKVVTYLDKENSGLTYYTLDELQNVNDDWFPLCCYKEGNTLIYGGRNKIIHTYVEGETGSGKTTRIAMQSIIALSSMNNKPSFVIADPYGEIYENTYLHFKEKDYNIKVINCDNPLRSDTYNPFLSLAKIVEKEGKITSEVQNQLKKIALIVEPLSERSNDPMWSQGACSYFNGLMLDFFEDLVKKEIKPEDITFYNIIQRHYQIRKELAVYASRSIFELGRYREKDPNSLSMQKMIAVTNNAERTRDSYFGVVENNIDRFGQQAIYQLSSNSTIDIEKIIHNPTVVFVQSSNTSVGDDLISLLINDLYNTVINIGKTYQTKRLPRNIHCFLDEFANFNFGNGEEFIRMLTTSRKFGLYWHMYLQCDAQLDKKYASAEIGNIIRANSTEIFLGSQDYKTIERFANSCGRKTIESLNSKMSQNNFSLETFNLITTDKLQTTPEGYMYIKVNKHPLLYSYFEPFYTCQQFERVESIGDIYPVNNFDYKAIQKNTTQTKRKKNKKNENFLDIFFEDEIDFESDDNKEETNDIKKPQTIYDKLQFLIDKMKWIETNKGNQILVVDIDKEEAQFNFIPDMKIYDFEDDLKLINKDTNDINDISSRNILQIEFLDKLSKEVLQSSIDKLTGYSMMPKYLIGILRNFDEYDYVQLKQLKQEIISAFINNNSFQTIEQWNDKCEDEYEEIKKLNILPECLIHQFKLAKEEIESYTINDFKEIKKIIDEGN